MNFILNIFLTFCFSCNERLNALKRTDELTTTWSRIYSWKTSSIVLRITCDRLSVSQQASPSADMRRTQSDQLHFSALSSSRLYFSLSLQAHYRRAEKKKSHWMCSCHWIERILSNTSCALGFDQTAKLFLSTSRSLSNLQTTLGRH